MTDIVERLRGKVPMVWEDEGFMVVDEDAVLATFTEAADEIERLRALLHDASGALWCWEPASEYGANHKKELTDKIHEVLGEGK